MTRDKQHMYLHGWTMSGMGGLLREPPHSFGGAKLVTGCDEASPLPCGDHRNVSGGLKRLV